MTRLSVNLNKIALLRNSRGRHTPDPAAFGRLALDAGAHGLTVHPRPDQRHARWDDLPVLAALVAEFPGAEFNIEGYPSEDFLQRVCRARPHQCTLVPDAPGQLTSDHGWNVLAHAPFLRDTVARLRDAGIRASLFLDADPAAIPTAAQTGTDRIELYTEPYAANHGTPRHAETLQRFAATARAALDAGLALNAGHDLSLDNLRDLLAAIPQIQEVSIGHALTAEALLHGWESTLRRYLDILSG